MDSNNSNHTAKKPRMAFYLDDNRPIRTIEVSNIDDSISAEYLRGYFEFAVEGGKVSDVKFDCPVNNGNQNRVAYVTFLLPEDAAMLLLQPNLKMRFAFKQADAEHQPEFDATTLKLTDINDHCLLNIASRLPPIDLVNLCKTCKRMESILVLIFQTKTHLSAIRNKVPHVKEEHLQTVLKAMGPFIKSIDWDLITRGTLEYLAEHCTNVEKLQLKSSIHLTSIHIKQNKAFFKNITSLRLVYCPSLHDNAMRTIVTSSNLKQLQVVNCRSMQGKFFKKWKDCQLTFLKIHNSPGISSAFLSRCAADRLSSLHRLNLDCRELDPDKVEILKSLQNLRVLTLKRVDTEMAARIYSSLYKHLPEIRRLKICTKNNEMDFKSVTDMVSSLTKLIRFSHSSMSWELLRMICIVRGLWKQSPLEIGISRKMFNDPKKLQPEKLKCAPAKPPKI